MKAYYFLFILVFATSCFQEELDPSDYEFRGSWDSPKYAIQIFMNGSATLNIINRGWLHGHVKVQQGDLVFTSTNEQDLIGYKRLRIDQRPTTDSNGVTYMIIEGHRLEKQ